jgi:hypothetical protein
MFGRNAGTTATVADTAGSVRKALVDVADAVVEYVDPLAKDEKLRRRLAAAIVAGSAARKRARKQTGVTGLARRLGSDPVLRAQVIELGAQLQAAQRRAKKARTHKLRNSLLVIGGVGMVIAAAPGMRKKLMSVVQKRQDEQAHAGQPERTEAAV